MDKELKKCYYNLDLSYQATIEDVEAREKALIKILKSKEFEKNISCRSEIKIIQDNAKLIKENIKNNGIPQEKCHHFESSTQSILALLIVFFFVAIICCFSFSLFL